MRNRPTPSSSRRRLKRITPAAGSPRSNEELFRMLIEDLHVGVLILGPRSEIQFANQSALDICGMTAKQVLGKTTHELGLVAIREDGTELPFSMRPGPRAASGNAVRNEVVGFRRPGSGQIVWIYGSAIPQFESDGSVRRVIATMTDITDRKSIEAEL